jgi:hypothetical protein
MESDLVEIPESDEIGIIDLLRLYIWSEKWIIRLGEVIRISSKDNEIDIYMIFSPISVILMTSYNLESKRYHLFFDISSRIDISYW